ncbi:MAG: hypothetical protein JO316_24540 [Abitibacteriaceae bacterium]|nr:hypothetical protein [Abditibacteriaceae bacterium]
MKSLKTLLIFLAIMALAGCGGSSLDGVNTPTPTPSTPTTPAGTQVFSFEKSLEGWSAHALDVYDPGQAPNAPPAIARWSVQHSGERATSGHTALKLSLDNLTDAGKVWIERPFSVQANQRYRVNVKYALATADFGDIGLWNLITGVSAQPPRTRDQLMFQGNTGNGSPTDVGYQWLEKTYSFDATSAMNGKLYVTIGVWGTFEVPRAYYLDNVRVTLAKL